MLKHCKGAGILTLPAAKQEEKNPTEIWLHLGLEDFFPYSSLETTINEHLRDVPFLRTTMSFILLPKERIF